MTKQLAHCLVTPHAVFSSRRTSSDDASLFLCFPPQAQAGTAALPVLVFCIPLVLQPPSLSQLFSCLVWFFLLLFLLNRHLKAHAYCQAVAREIIILCKFTYGSSDSLNVSARVCRMFEHVPLLRWELTII